MSKQKINLYVGIVAMLGLVAGTFLQGGSLLQKALFLIGALVLTGIAYVDKRKMYIALEVVISISAVLAFWNIEEFWKYFIFVGAAIIGIWYLIWIQYNKEDKYWYIGGGRSIAHCDWNGDKRGCASDAF